MMLIVSVLSACSVFVFVSNLVILAWISNCKSQSRGYDWKSARRQCTNGTLQASWNWFVEQFMHITIKYHSSTTFQFCKR